MPASSAATIGVVNAGITAARLARAVPSVRWSTAGWSGATWVNTPTMYAGRTSNSASSTGVRRNCRAPIRTAATTRPRRTTPPDRPAGGALTPTTSGPCPEWARPEWA
jgi:hypothetical protein